METEACEKSCKKRLVYNEIPKQVLRRDFNKHIKPHLKKRMKGPKPKLSFYKIFNYILYVLHTGIQWDQLRTRRNELHWSNVYKWHNRKTCFLYLSLLNNLVWSGIICFHFHSSL